VPGKELLLDDVDAASIAGALSAAELTPVPIGEWHVMNVRQQRSEAGVLASLAGGQRNRSRGPAVECSTKGDDGGSPCRVTRKLDRSFNRFSAGVGEEHPFLRRSRGNPGEALTQSSHGLVVEV
jgi:hypothetical protein